MIAMAINKKLKAVYLLLVTFVLICVHQSTGSEDSRMNKKKLETVDRSQNEIKENVTIPVEYRDSVTQSVDIDNEITAKKEHVTVEKTTSPTTNDAKVQGTFTTKSSKPTTEDRKRGKSQTTTQPQTKATTTPPKRQDRIDSMDQYLLDGILDIVDEKFDTLNKRLMTLERGVNNLQYYNVRSFRVVNTHLHAVDTILHTIHSQIGQNEQQNKLIEQSVGALKNEITDLQSMNSGMFQAIEQNLVLVHQDLEQRINSVQESVEESTVQLSELKNVTAEMKTGIEQIENLQVKAEENSETSMILASNILEKSTLCVNTTSDTFVLTEKINRQTKKLGDTLGNISESVSVLSTDTLEIKQGLSSALTNISVAKVNKDQFGVEEGESGDNYKEFRATNSQIQMSCGKMLEILDDKLKHLNVTLSVGQQKDDKCDNKGNIPVDFKNQSRKLLRALSTVNENIFQSVTLYRHTGNLIERVISDTELIASEQVRLREELVAYLLNGTFDLFNHTIPDFADVIATRGKNSDTNVNESQTCAVTKSLIDEVLKLSFNGTQLVQMLTDLATTSSSSIQLSIDKLDKEIGRLNKIQSDTHPQLYQRHETYIRDDPKAGGNNQIKDIQNKTDWIYQLSEAIASNTGWIPYVFHNLRFVENQVNKTLKLVTSIDTRSEEMLVRQRANMAIMFKPKQPSTPSPVVKTHVTEKTNADDQRGTAADGVSCVVNASQNTLFEQMMSYVYSTNRKLNRLVPALTNLLGEPEPLIALIDGNTDREGRVEIYYKGQWGTLPGSLDHVEASYVCRKLGFLGGVSVGNGHFGAGSGQFWNLNVTCLRTRWCSAVSHVANGSKYNHSQDVGVVCDHMLRLTQTNEDEEQEVTRHTGKLEFYHKNHWIPVCSKSWGRQETDVACRQLGFREGSATDVKDDSLVDSNWMTNVTCKGNENRLDACVFETLDSSGCPDLKYVSLICS